jgi:hypothetical protein
VRPFTAPLQSLWPKIRVLMALAQRWLANVLGVTRWNGQRGVSVDAVGA